ncbi:MAG: asparagine synthase (glutamine-hydrolyzing) [Planctomycetes bacterium]|nr:asparagine synthase (glutamine-hydrolyzing) [Planctomycetota bacterium]
MCGIAGVISLDPRPVEGAVRRAMAAMIHRGPDDEGYEQFSLTDVAYGPACGFGFRRLAVMDLSPLGHQPMVNALTGDAIVFNGEIYNFASIREQLVTVGCRFKSSGDTEVLLQALSAWGEDALPKLDGMFAIAFFHAASRRVMLARDPLGIKPLYTARVGNVFAFASEVRALLATALVPKDLDPAGVASFMAYGAPQDPLTVHRFIRSMPPATCVWIGSDSLNKPPPARRYWRFPPAQSAVDERTAVDHVRSILEESVRLQSISDVLLGVFLSGGIDSGTMAALAQLGEKPPMTFAVGYESAGMPDETVAAAETADFLGTRHFQTIVDNEWVILQLSEWFKAADRPSIDGLNTFIVSGAVKDRGMTVALSGLGADELFGGYGNFRRIPQLQQFLRIIAWLPSSVRRAAAAALLAPLPHSTRAKAVDLVSRGASTLELAVLGRRLHDDATLRLLGFDSRRLGLSPDYLPSEAYDALNTSSRDPVQVISEVEASLYMGNTLLRDSDVNGMAHSLEIRVPFLGRSVVNYACSLPGNTRLPHGRPGKHLLRRAFANTLPASVFNRPKSGFSLPFAEWLFGPLRDQCEAAIETLTHCPVIDGRAVLRRWGDYTGNRSATHWSRPLSLVVLGAYLQKTGE